MKFSQLDRGTYAAVKFSNDTLDALCDLQDKLKLFDATPRDKLHSTICYSRVFVPFKPMDNLGIIAYAKDFEIFEHNGKRALVLLLDSPYLHSRFAYAQALGATYDFPDYQPHITLAYDIGAMAKPKLEFKISIGATHEYVEDLDLDWSPEK
ncbi:RNA ligase [Acinetobacter phage ZZ1]|jgi:hypothetical protein|uniref:Anti-CBASS protein Acb1 n=3 Tax=Caudoviricetes TaxID=2731619 RepID=A0A410T5J9_9CAUD|nr:RNA ligase [Acinetobacter phage ZZ1]AEJ90208.1 hypothetical protein ZZ1p0155 [Acinetobacter phage ZZ1]QAU04008.1 hypothetical protein Henu6_gp205 [Acinetobacter phage Henu6]